MGRRIGIFGLVNFKAHPADKDYMVFNYNSPDEAELFDELLTKGKIWFERDKEEVDGKTMYLFAVKERDFQRVQKFNFEVTGRYKKPMIKNRIIRYAVLAFFFAILTFAIVGYVKNTKLYKPEKVENSSE